MSIIILAFVISAQKIIFHAMKNLILFFAFLFIAAPARADSPATAAPPDVTPEQIENYFENLDTARARFVQTVHDGTQLVGTFYLDRPGKLRFEYDPPVEDYVVADGLFIYFYDAELQEQTNAPIGQTLADFILRKNLNYAEDLRITDLQRGGGLLQVTFVQEADPEAGSLTLGFTEDPLELKKWRVVDSQGLITEVELFYLKTGVTHPAGLFVYKDPKPQRPQYNR